MVCEWCGKPLRIPQAVKIIADWRLYATRTFHSLCLDKAAGDAREYRELRDMEDG